MESAQASDGSDTYLQAAGPNFLVLSSWKVNIAENPIAVMGLLIRSGRNLQN